jgi:hypothetical protein
MRPGIDLLDESVDTGALLVRHKYYRIRLKLWLKRGDPVRWAEPWGVLSQARLSDDGTTLTTVVRLHREQLTQRVAGVTTRVRLSARSAAVDRKRGVR